MCCCDDVGIAIIRGLPNDIYLNIFVVITVKPRNRNKEDLALGVVAVSVICGLW